MIEEPLLTWKGRRVRSPGDGPEAAARKVPADPRPGSLFFVPSPLEGWGLDVLLARLPADAAVVLYEKDSELRAHCRVSLERFLDAQVTDSRLFWLDEDSEDDVRRLFGQLPLSRLRRCEFLTFSGSWMAHGPRYREVFARLEQGLTRWWSNRITSIHMGPLWIRNLFDNLSASGFRQRPWPHWGQQLTMVCGAGVSLESALPWALKHRSGLRLIAADTALPVLHAWGLLPDAVVCLESQHANLRDFAGWSGADVPLFADLTAFPPSTRVFSNSPHWFITEFAELSLWKRWPWPAEEIPRLPPLGSVGVAAAWIAWKLSDGPVLLAGLDFSYPAGQTHARGAPSLSSLGARSSRFIPHEQTGSWERTGVRRTDSGWLTTPVMEGYAAVLSDQAGKYADRTWVWDQRGLPLGLRPWAGTVSTKKTHTVVRDPVEVSMAWLDEERLRLQTVLETFVKLNRDPSTAADLERLLSEVDYLTFHFPDPEYRSESDWLIRAQRQVRWLLSRLD